MGKPWRFFVLALVALVVAEAFRWLPVSEDTAVGIGLVCGIVGLTAMAFWITALILTHLEWE